VGIDAPLHWYFAYGSNLDPRTFLGRRRMRPQAARRARLDDFRLVFDLPVGRGERAVANLRHEPGELVCGVAWQISASDASRLDRSEGVHRGYYLRRQVGLWSDDADAFEGFTYVSRHGHAGRKPSARYLGLLLAGARHHALPEEWIRHLHSFELAVDERRDGQGELLA
jgi:cation transport regulator ChaC